jgi:phosphopantothenoylcysteine decarboxylase / phosphopantothenate---cysteine ligase
VNPHPSEDIRSTLGEALKGRRIALCMTGSVAAVKSPELARLLMRHGAEVFPVMSRAAAELIGPTLMHWATGNEPVTELTGAIEHVALAGNVPYKVDLVLVAPATANTIGKIAAGIDDTTVTTVVTTALGEGIPMIVVPAMHEPMYQHPIVHENLEKLARIGVQVVMPRVEEGKAKIADSETVTRAVIATLGMTPPGETAGDTAGAAAASGSGSLAGKRVLITAGRTVEYLDPIRVLTNNSTGKMGMALAAASLAQGADVTIVFGKGTAVPPPGATVIRVETAEEMAAAVSSELGGKAPYDIMMAAAAVGDWRPLEQATKKISTHDSNRLVIELEPTPKIIDGIKSIYPDIFLLAFRAQHDLTEDDLIADAAARARKADADLIAVNDVSKAGAGFETDTNEMFLVDQDGKREHLPMGSKSEIARLIVAAVSRRL